jgi:uncharacterized RDD family membrane protein YckC
MSFERVHLWHMRTPEGVSFSFRLASPVLRAVAAGIDMMVVSAAWTVLSTVLGLIGVVGGDIAQGLGFVAYFVLSEGYRILTEWAWRGQTIGKRVMRLRVVDEQGLRLTFAQIVMRNLLRFIDALPFAYLVGGVAALLNRRAQRLGDLAAGTLVIWEPQEMLPDLETFQSSKYNSLRSHPPAVARLRQAVNAEEARIAWQALARRDQLDPDARVRLFGELAEHFRARTALPPEATEGVSDEQLVRNVVDVLYLSRR